jgi:hypothetical protein
VAVDKATWNTLLTVAAILIPVIAVGSLFTTRPRRQVLAAFLPTLVASIVIYVATGGGASVFHTAVVICGSLALGFAFFLTRLEPKRDRLATYAWALLGVVTPYLSFFALLTAVCWGKTECI